MIKPLGNKMIGLPFGDLKLIEEILSFDGNPMLLHFTNKKGEDIIAYWVDYGDSLVRWLYVKILKSELHLYLTGRSSLKSIFENTTSQYLFLADFDENGIIIDVNIITPLEIPERYMPGKDSFFTEGLSEFYLDYLTDADFHHNLKERSFIITGKPSNINTTHSTHYLTAKETAFMLSSITDCAEGYVLVEARNKYEKKWVSKTKVNKVSKDLKNHLTPIVTGAEIHSFEVWLSMDTMTLNNLDDTGNELKNEIVEGFKKNVLDVDFTSKDDAKIICDKYNPSERKIIYGPLIELLENDKINITVSDKLKTIRDIGKPIKVNSAFRDLVLPKPTLEEVLADTERKKRIVTLILSLDEGTDIKRISKREIVDNLLIFGGDVELPFPIQSPIEIKEATLFLKKPILAMLKISDGDLIEITGQSFDLYVKGKDLPTLNKEIREQFYKFVLPYLEGKKADIETLALIEEYIDLPKKK